MKYSLAISSEAAAAYETALSWIAAVNPLAAQRFGAACIRSLQRLQSFPRLGFTVSEHAAVGLREIIVGSYRFWYLVDDRRRRVLVVDVSHLSQLPRAPELPVDV